MRSCSWSDAILTKLRSHRSSERESIAGPIAPLQDAKLTRSEFQQHFPAIEELEELEKVEYFKVVGNEHGPSVPRHLHTTPNSASQLIPTPIFTQPLPILPFDHAHHSPSTLIAPTHNVLVGQVTPRNQQSIRSVIPKPPRPPHRKLQPCTACQQPNCPSDSICGGYHNLHPLVCPVDRLDIKVGC